MTDKMILKNKDVQFTLVDESQFEDFEEYKCELKYGVINTMNFPAESFFLIHDNFQSANIRLFISNKRKHINLLSEILDLIFMVFIFYIMLLIKINN